VWGGKTSGQRDAHLKSGAQVRAEGRKAATSGRIEHGKLGLVVAVVGLGRIGSRMASLLQPVRRACAGVRSLT